MPLRSLPSRRFIFERQRQELTFITISVEVTYDKLPRT